MRFFIPQIYKEDFTLPNHMTKDINKRKPPTTQGHRGRNKIK
jgi:hypothetical protein